MKHALAAWAHMLGFPGHFSTKSRAYSTTLGALRAERAAHQREYAKAAGLVPDLGGSTTLVIADWDFAGRGHPPGWPDLSLNSQSDLSRRDGGDAVA
jgi:hypothetical protein